MRLVGAESGSESITPLMEASAPSIQTQVQAKPSAEAIRVRSDPDGPHSVTGVTRRNPVDHGFTVRLTLGRS